MTIWLASEQQKDRCESGPACYWQQCLQHVGCAGSGSEQHAASRGPSPSKSARSYGGAGTGATRLDA